MMMLQLLYGIALFGTAALAANLKDVQACVVSTTNALQISGSYCGSGTSVQFSGSALATVTQQCFTQSGQPVEGQPKTTTIPITISSQPIPLASTGCTPFCFTTAPIQPTLACTGTQEARIIGGVTYTNIVLSGTNLPKDFEIASVSNTCTTTCSS